MTSERNTTRLTFKGVTIKPQKMVEAAGLEGIAVGRNWRLGADALNIILYRRRVGKTGKETWKANSYHATIANALVELVNQGVRDTGLKDLKTVCDKIDELRKDILFER